MNQALMAAEARIEHAAKVIEECSNYMREEAPELTEDAAAFLGSRFTKALEVLNWKPSDELDVMWRKAEAIHAGEEALASDRRALVEERLRGLVKEFEPLAENLIVTGAKHRLKAEMEREIKGLTEPAPAWQDHAAWKRAWKELNRMEDLLVQANSYAALVGMVQPVDLDKWERGALSTLGQELVERTEELYGHWQAVHAAMLEQPPENDGEEDEGEGEDKAKAEAA